MRLFRGLRRRASALLPGLAATGMRMPHTRRRRVHEAKGGEKNTRRGAIRTPARGVNASQALGQQAIGGMDETEHFAGDLLDQVGIGPLGGQEPDVASELLPHGFEARELELEERDAFDEQ
jgi:hypothetical protein